jgi:hypothetical protein
MTNAIPATQNESWGFYGTMDKHAAAAWPLAMDAVAEATGKNFDAVRCFLDSRHGRHFADAVRSGLFYGDALADAIAAAVKKWMDWRIDWQTAKRYDIHQGAPYLTEFVIHCEIVEHIAVTF